LHALEIAGQHFLAERSESGQSFPFQSMMKRMPENTAAQPATGIPQAWCVTMPLAAAAKPTAATTNKIAAAIRVALAVSHLATAQAPSGH
jgi:hypothetical protein